MLEVVIPPQEVFNDKTQEFGVIPGGTFKVEHSLVSLAKWESKWEKPFLSETQMNREETIDYIRCMTITQNVPEHLYKMIPEHVA